MSIPASSGYISEKAALFNENVLETLAIRDAIMEEVAQDSSNPILLAEYQAALIESSLTQETQSNTIVVLKKNGENYTQNLTR